jgi:hypothetical protein
MLIRVSGGEEGIKEYLEEGHKQGREFSRDELDERVILAGDLDFTHEIINRIERGHDRYLHITLSFKEDEIQEETLRDIAEDFRKFMFSAYQDDEYNFYAEAHLPKIKSYEHQRTGETVERKPHIHIVVPKINLRSGGALNPVGLLERSERHFDACQEHINNKYGLASPKDNRRVHFTDASDMIQRYRDDNFAGTYKELKKSILTAVMERDITSYQEFGKLVEEYGATKIRNAGSDTAYFNVKPEGSAKGVNLKDYPFSREFIELPGEQKQKILSAEVQREYEIQGQARKDKGNIDAALKDWHQFRAKEIKYLNSGNKKLYRAYRQASADDRAKMLDQLAAKFYTRYPEPNFQSEPFTGKNPFAPDYPFKRTSRGGDEQQGPGQAGNPLERVDRGGRIAKHDYGQSIDQFGTHPARERVPHPAGHFEQTHTRNQEHDHEPARYAGKNRVGHEYGFKRPHGGGDRDTLQGRSERATRPGAVGTDRHGDSMGRRAYGAFGRVGTGPGAADRQHDALSLRQVEQAHSINRLRNVPGGSVVRTRQEAAMLLPHHAPDQLGNGRGQSDHALRRPRDRKPVRGSGRVSDSVVSQVARDFAERQRAGGAGKLPLFQEIKQQLDANRLLAELSRSHGLMVEKYKVTAAPDGSARILCGNRYLNVCDFMTKEVRLPWAEAATILQHSYGRQVDRHPEMAPRFPPDRALWRAFQDQRRARGGLRSQLSAQLASERARREAIRYRLSNARAAAAGLPAAQRKAALSVARMEYVTSESALRSAIRLERAPFRLPVADQYRQFLQQRAQAGEAAALAELRRRSRSAAAPLDPAVGQILPVKSFQEPNGLFYRGREVRFRVRQNGDVIYSLAGRVMIEDKGESVRLLRTERVAIEAALRLAQAKFGDRLKLSGSAEFQERAARIAAEARLNVRFDNKHAEHIRNQIATELASQRAVGRHFVEQQKSEGPTQARQPAQEKRETQKRDLRNTKQGKDEKDVER